MLAVAGVATASPVAAAKTLRPVKAYAAHACETRSSLRVGGPQHCVVKLRYRLPADVRVATASARLRAGVSVSVRRRRLGRMRSGHPLDVSRALKGRTIVLTFRAGRSPVRLARRGSRTPVLTVRGAAILSGSPGSSSGGGSGSGGVPPSRPSLGGAVWVSAAELARHPTSGASWAGVVTHANQLSGAAKLSDQNSEHDTQTLAAALVWARTGDATQRQKVHDAVLSAIGSEAGGRTLALGRNLVGYVVAADLISLRTFDPAGDQRLRTWLAAVRTEPLDGSDSLVSTHETRPNNWGTMNGASRIAIDLYLSDGADLQRAADVFRGYLGERSVYAGFDYGELSWQANPSAPVGINPVGASKGGLLIDGALPDDMRRGCSFKLPPCHTGYPWEAMQGVVVAADLLDRHGYPAFAWSDQAVLRAALFLGRLDTQYGGWWATSDDTWQPWLINHAYGTALPTVTPASPGKVLGFTDWVYGP